jgi:hypothetical protein
MKPNRIEDWTTHGRIDDVAAILEAHGCKVTAADLLDTKRVIPNLPIATGLSARPEGGLRVTELEARLGTVQKALQRVVDASDQFVKDTGLKHGDLITDAVEAARKVLPPAHIRAGVDFITDTRLGGD